MVSIKNPSETARKIRELREKEGISVQKMAEACGIGSAGISVDEYNAIESGSHVDLMKQNVGYICAKLMVSLRDIGVECHELDIDEIDAQEQRSDH